MTVTGETLYGFFSSFGLPAYVEYEVPDDAKLPYITYKLKEPHWADTTTIYARVWYRDTNLRAISAKVDEIAVAVGEGLSIPTENGCIVLYRGTEWAQLMPMEGDDTLRVYYLLFDLSCYT